MISGTLNPAQPVAVPGSETGTGNLFSPVVDFFCLGGISLVLMPILLLMPVSAQPPLAAVMAVIWYAINGPHFAASYQIFYRDFRHKAFGSALSPKLRIRYLFAAIGVPVGLAIFFIAALVQPDARMLGYGGNLMFLLVGWHYAKQGYGILIVDSVLKKQFFNRREKGILLLNAYACWLFSWMLVNSMIRTNLYFHIAYFGLLIPKIILCGAGGMALATSVATLCMMARKIFTGGQHTMPVNGTVAYLVTIYSWLTIRLNPVMLLVVPVLHSLQYLMIVWRFEINRARAEAKSRLSWVWRVAGFAGLALLLGYVGFTGGPAFLGKLIAYRPDIFGSALYFFVAAIFINIHHYFLDNVTWRGDNPETAAYLFQSDRHPQSLRMMAGEVK